MPTVITLLFVILIVIFVLSLVTKSAKKNILPRTRLHKIDYSSVPLPVGLDLRKELPLEALEQRMNEALSPLFLEQLKQRVMAGYPNLNAMEYEWKLLELKRYFVMNAILRQVPMFSEGVDEIWHEMLMFTREYQQFSDKITGGMIHHTPKTQKESLPDERAWFDWVYGHLFEFTPFSDTIWNRFYRFPLSKVRIEQLRSLSEQEIYERLFNVRAAEIYPEIKSAIDLLIKQAKAQINDSDESRNSFNRGSNFQPMDAMGYAAGAMIFYSMMDSGGYEGNMNALLPDETERQQDGSGSGSSSCGTGDNSSSSNCSSDGSSDGGGSSGCSSSSSCGSSCGGGGGD